MKTVTNKMVGFSLVELLIAVSVVAILAGVALPSYRAQVMETRRADGQAALMTALALQEQYYLDNKTYASSMAALGYTTTDSEGGYYAIGIAAGATANSFTLEATPKGAQSGDSCGKLTINHLGVKGESGNSTKVEDCW